MTKRKLKKEVVGMLGLAILIGVFTIFELTANKPTKKEETHVNKTIFENNIPVVATKEVISRPYKDNTVKVVTNFYKKDDDEETQKKSIIYFENTYIPSTGIDYQTDYDFDVIAILDGVIMSIKEDQNLGKIIEIKHNDNVISTYQSLSEIIVKEGDQVKQGDIIAKSGTSNIKKDLGSHLHFELTINSKTVDPEDYYDKELGSI